MSTQSTTSPGRLGVGLKTISELAAMLDVSAVRADSTLNDVQAVADFVQKYDCIAAFSLPCFTDILAKLLKGAPEIKIGGAVGFPSGGETTAMKVTQAKELVQSGCGEIDMVMNVGKMLSGDLKFVESDIRSVKEAIGSITLKVILECTYLSNDQICAASECCVRAGANWVKTGTGWTSTGTTLEQVRLIKQTVGDRARVKAAGGVRDLDTILKMIQLGVERFGIGVRTAKSVVDEFEHRNKLSQEQGSRRAGG